MESGFKRLWTRQRTKSKPRASGPATFEFQKTPTYEVYVSGPPPQIGTLPFKPSDARSTAKVGIHGKTGSDAYQDYRRWYDAEVANSSLRPSGGIQPVLVGISRPVTASSLSRAVSQAADAVLSDRPVTTQTNSAAGSRVSYDRPSTAQTTLTAGKRHQKPGKARYIDIFQVTTQKPGTADRYNEDIAERNLDFEKLALVEDTINGYNPSSKYQEEVADRNVSMDLSRASSEIPRPSREHATRVVDSVPREPFTEQMHPYEYRHAPASSLGSNKAPSANKSTVTQQPRLYSMEGRGKPSQLPPIPQNKVADPIRPSGKPLLSSAQREEFHRNIEATLSQHQSNKAESQAYPSASAVPQQKSKALQNQGKKVDPITYSPPTIGPQQRLKASQHQSAESSNVMTPSKRPLLDSSARGISNLSTATQHSASSMPDYQVSAAETAVNRFRGASDQARKTNGHAYSNSSWTAESYDSASVQSSVSNAPLKKVVNLSNRTIMDLTGDDSDIFTDTDGGSSYVESPVVQQAQFSPLYSAQPAIVIPGDHVTATTLSATELEPPNLKQQSFLDLADIEAPMRAKVLQREIEKQNRLSSEYGDGGDITPTAAEPHSAFSQVKTVASFSPRSSITNSDVPGLSPTQHTIEAAADPEQAPKPMFSVYSAITKNQLTPVVPLSISVMPPSDNDKNDAVDSPTIPLHPAPRSKPPPKSKFQKQGKLPPLVEDVPQTTLVSTPVSKQLQQKEGQSSPAPVYSSPQSLNSNDFVHPNQAFAVSARDFAAVPGSRDISDESSEQSELTPKNSVRRGPYSAGKIYDPSSPPRYVETTTGQSYDSDFDEEEFARKQGQAKAALERLQKSLQDDFDEPAMPSPLLRELAAPAPVIDRRPQVPTSKFTHNIWPMPSKVAGEEQRPPPPKQSTSFHSMVTSPTTTPVGSPGVSRHATRVSRRDDTESNLTPVRPYFDLGGGGSGNPPVSPSEISLSSFPLPAPTPQHSRQVSLKRPVTANGRTNSLKSLSSNASAFSIPYHMVPGRSSSMRDQVDNFSLDE